MDRHNLKNLLDIVAVEIIASLTTVNASAFSVDAILPEPEPASGSGTTARSQSPGTTPPCSAQERTAQFGGN